MNKNKNNKITNIDDQLFNIFLLIFYFLLHWLIITEKPNRVPLSIS
jgi:hypothetical protein